MEDFYINKTTLVCALSGVKTKGHKILKERNIIYAHGHANTKLLKSKMP